MEAHSNVEADERTLTSETDLNDFGISVHKNTLNRWYQIMHMARIIDIKKPSTRVYYDLQEIGRPNLGDVLDDFVKKQGL